MLMLVLLGAVDPQVAACVADDAWACHALGSQAALTDDPASRAEALEHFQHGCQLGYGPSCREAAALIEARNPEAAEHLRQRAERLGDGPAPPPRPPAPATEPAPPVSSTAEISDDLQERGPAGNPNGSRFGVIAYAAVGGTSGVGPGVLGGLGMRFGLRERSEEPVMFMPALGLVGGVLWDPAGLKPWAEVRFEAMGAVNGGVLQPAWHGWLSAGFAFRSLIGSADMTRQAAAPVARPYFGAGTGWNWLPGGGSGGGLNLGGSAQAAIVAAAVLTFVFAGRVELRVAPPLDQAGTEVTLLFGVGF
jgi:hypothetical protein